MIRSGGKLAQNDKIRGKKDFQSKFGLIDEDMCDMCKQGKETNKHLMNECTHIQHAQIHEGK